MVRHLPISDETRAALGALAERAAQPANWWDPADGTIPGDIPTYVVVVGSFRVVFTWTAQRGDGHPHRHMSISTVGAPRGRVPAPPAVWTVAHMLGFTGASVDEHGVVAQPASGWALSVDPEGNCVVVGQCVKPDEIPPPAGVPQ